MLAHRRAFAIPELESELSTFELYHPSFRIRVERTRNIVIDDALTYPTVGWTGYSNRARLDVVLQGQVRDTENGTVRHLGPGDFAIGRALESLYARVAGDDYLCLAIEWNLGSLGTNTPIGLPTGRLGANDVASLRRAVDELSALEAANREAQLRPMLEILSVLRSAGVPFDGWRARDLVVEVPPVLQRVADVVGRSLSQLSVAPTSTMLERELGMTRRCVSLAVGELAARYGFNGLDWRTIRDRWRLTMGIAAMSHPRARTEDVARALGYSSPNALCQAFRSAGLPSPGNIRDALARIE